MKAFHNLLLISLLAILSSAPEARASVNIAVSLETLVQRSDAVVVLVPLEQEARFVGKIIVTTTKARVDETVDGALTTREVLITTRGGGVGNIGQHVEGEVVLRIGAPTLTFLRKQGEGSFLVTAGAQGAYPLRGAPSAWRLEPSPHLGHIVARAIHAPMALENPASEVLGGRSLDEVRARVHEAWRRRESRPKQ